MVWRAIESAAAGGGSEDRPRGEPAQKREADGPCRAQRPQGPLGIYYLIDL